MADSHKHRRPPPQSPPHSGSRPSTKVPRPPTISNRVNRNAAINKSKTAKKKKRPSLKATQSMKDETIITEQLLPSSYKRNYRTNANDDMHPSLHKSATIAMSNANKNNNKKHSASLQHGALSQSAKKHSIGSGSRWSNHPLYKDFDDNKDANHRQSKSKPSKPPPPAPKHE